MSYDTVVLGDAPVAFWPLNESSGTTATDATGNGHTGTYTGTVTLGQTGIGDGETAALFDGSTGYVTVPDAAALRVIGDLSLEAWVNITDLSTYRWLIAKTNGGGGTNNPYEWRVESGSHDQFLWQADASGQSAGNSSASPVPGSTWHYIVVTRTGSTGAVIYYLDGLNDGGGVIPHNPPTDSGQPLLIGTRGDHFTFYKGVMAKAAIYNAVLTPTQVSVHYAAAAAVAATGSMFPFLV